MKINFYLDEVFYEGTAVPFENPGESKTLYVVRLTDPGIPVFHAYQSVTGEWLSDDLASAGLVTAVGAEIEKQDIDESSDIELKHYTSSALLSKVGDTVEVTENGEIINEPDDVAERSFDKPQNY